MVWFIKYQLPLQTRWDQTHYKTWREILNMKNDGFIPELFKILWNYSNVLMTIKKKTLPDALLSFSFINSRLRPSLKSPPSWSHNCNRHPFALWHIQNKINAVCLFLEHPWACICIFAGQVHVTSRAVSRPQWYKTTSLDELFEPWQTLNTPYSNTSH